METIVALPVLFIALLAVVEFGLLSMHQSCLQQARRAGADAATHSPLPTSGPVPDGILEAVNAVLECKGMTADCVRVEHNLARGGPYVLNAGIGAAPPMAPAPDQHPYVRVSVCVENTQLAPNLLRTYCVDLSGDLSQKSTTRCYPVR